jgi:hypothetical protein
VSSFKEVDELATVLKPAGAYDFWPQKAAEFALAAGYRKPHTITTAEELDALGQSATILDAADHVWTNDGDTLDQWGSVTTPESYGGPKWVGSADIELPATLIHEGVTL